MTIRLLALAMFAVALALPARADEDADPEPSLLAGKTFKTPQAVFDAYVAASEKKDYKGTLSCLTTQAQKDMAAYLAYNMLAMKSSDLGQTYKPMFDVMDKHGLTDKATKDIKVGFNAEKKDQDTARAALSKLIKKPIPFTLDMIKAQEKLVQAVPQQFANIKYTLSDLKTDGDKATGVMVIDFSGIKTKQKVSFAKSGGWKMIPSFDLGPPDIEVQPQPNQPKRERQ